MEHINSDSSETQKLHVHEMEQYIRYFSRETETICTHLDKLDRLPLDECFDFRVYFDQREFVYSGDPDHSPTRNADPS